MFPLGFSRDKSFESRLLFPVAEEPNYFDSTSGDLRQPKQRAVLKLYKRVTI